MAGYARMEEGPCSYVTLFVVVLGDVAARGEDWVCDGRVGIARGIISIKQEMVHVRLVPHERLL
ncbi:hypothetical protein HAX54_034151, partial [Datura stramonium]|nr:hypothetical protein [Datura stramonium]